MDDFDLKITERDAPPARTVPPSLPPVIHLTPPPLDLLADLVLPNLGPPPGRDDGQVHVTEVAFSDVTEGPVADVGSHSKLTPLPQDMGPDNVPPAQPTERRPRGTVALPRLRESIRSPEEVEQARGERSRSGDTGGGWPVLVIGAVGAAFLCAVPLVVWVALQHRPVANAPAATAFENELMGIPVRQDLKLPAE